MCNIISADTSLLETDGYYTHGAFLPFRSWFSFFLFRENAVFRSETIWPSVFLYILYNERTCWYRYFSQCRDQVASFRTNAVVKVV